jgi:hypothetical protein
LCWHTIFSSTNRINSNSQGIVLTWHYDIWQQIGRLSLLFQRGTVCTVFQPVSCAISVGGLQAYRRAVVTIFLALWFLFFPLVNLILLEH